ncbi:MAG: hypothetical protein ABI758_01405 [Candidatus Woesebacteria bacterium]
MKKIIIIATLLLLIGFVCTCFKAQAQEPEATPDSVTQTLKDRVQRVMQSGQGQVEGTVTEQKTTFGLIGTLEKIVGSTVQIKTYQGATRIAEVEKTASIKRLGKVIAYEELELNSPVIATGILDPNGEYRVNSLKIVDDTIFPSKRQTILGTLETLTTRAITFTLVGPQEATSSSAVVTSKTTFLDILGQKVDKKLFKAGQQIIAVLPEGGSATSSALRVYSLTLTPTSTKSATLTP